MTYLMLLLKMRSVLERKYKILDEDGELLREYTRRDIAEAFIRTRPDCTLVEPIPIFDWRNSECLF